MRSVEESKQEQPEYLVSNKNNKQHFKSMQANNKEAFFEP